MSPRFLDTKRVSAPLPPPDPSDLALQNVYLRAEVLDLKGDVDATVKAVQDWAKTLAGTDKGRKARSTALLISLGDGRWSDEHILDNLKALEAVRWIVEGMTPSGPLGSVLVWGPLDRVLMADFVNVDEDRLNTEPWNSRVPTSPDGQSAPVGCLYGGRIGDYSVIFMEDHTYLYKVRGSEYGYRRRRTYDILRVDLGPPRKAVWLQDPTYVGYAERIKHALGRLGLKNVRVPSVVFPRVHGPSMSLRGYPTDWT